VVAAAKGTIQVKSEVAAGAVFTITLPLDAQDNPSSIKGEPA
jgi:signal transduction histidine kinase